MFLPFTKFQELKIGKKQQNLGSINTPQSISFWNLHCMAFVQGKPLDYLTVNQKEGYHIPDQPDENKIQPQILYWDSDFKEEAEQNLIIQVLKQETTKEADK